MLDGLIIGAGVAGLTCAQHLQQHGFRVAVIEKSRGLGGRVATRRLQGTWVDHGVPYLEAQGDRSQHLIQTLEQQAVLERWTDGRYELRQDEQIQTVSPAFPCYGSPSGMTTVAKMLATNLTIWRNQRVTAIAPTAQQTWSVSLDSPSPDSPAPTANELAASVLVVAIPAPQAVTLLDPLIAQGLPPTLVENLRSVTFDPCLSAIAIYGNERQAEATQLPWRSLACPYDADISWVGLDSSKRPASNQPAFVIRSSSAFAQRYLDASDLKPAGHKLLRHAAEILLPWLQSPELLQVHRWRYAFVSNPWQNDFLMAESPLPVICCGDWCGGNQLEQALQSGLAAADQVSRVLRGTAICDP